MMTREQIVDRISELLIQSYSVLFETQDLQITDFQKVVTNGFITAGRTDMNDRLVVYKEDLHANKEDEDLINYIYNQQFIADNIFEAVDLHEPRAQVIDVDVNLLPDQNTVRISVTFEVLSVGETVTLDLNLARLR